MRLNLSLDELVEMGLKHAKSVLIGASDAQLLPTFHIQFKDRAPAVMATPWTGERDKSATIAAMRAAIKIYGRRIVNYSFLSEAWVATQDHRPRADDLTPSQRETRKECVVVTAGDHDGARMKMWEIVRDDQGRVTDLVEEAADRFEGFEGRLFNLMEADDAP
jgi:hypothetical protein